MSNDRLRWSGNVQAQKEADEAFKRLKDKPKKKAATKKKENKKPTRKRRTRRKVDYHAYINSKRWARKRQLKIEQVGGKCEECERTNMLQVHHLTYRRLGYEKLKDLQVLCVDCHNSQHEDKEIFDSLTREFLAMAKTF